MGTYFAYCSFFNELINTSTYRQLENEFIIYFAYSYYL